MKKISIITISLLLSSCANYTLNETAFCNLEGIVKSCKDKNGEPTNGTVRGKHEYFSTSNGLLEDGYTGYDIHGSVGVRTHFKDGKKDGVEKEYAHADGSLSRETEYKDGEKNGIEKTYHKNGQLERETEYKDGREVGIEKTYHENGQLGRETEYKDGKKDGVEKKYSYFGVLRGETEYKDGKKDGVEKEYSYFGVLSRETEYKDGEKNGIEKTYHENGQLERETEYKDGREDGVKKEYDEDGNLIESTKFKNGIDTKTIAYRECVKKANTCWSGDLGKNGLRIGCRKDLNFGAVVYDITNEGVIVKDGDSFIHVHTNKKYVNGADMLSYYYYEYTGTYEYITVEGGKRRIHAYKETKIPVCH